MTLIPAAFHFSIYAAGEPAPVVRIFTPSSITMSATSAAFGAASMMFTPNGLSVNVLHFLISALTASVPKFMEEMRPSPPAFETAAARFASAIHAMPPWNNGYFIPRISQIGLLIIFLIIIMFYPANIVIFTIQVLQHRIAGLHQTR